MMMIMMMEKLTTFPEYYQYACFNEKSFSNIVFLVFSCLKAWEYWGKFGLIVGYSCGIWSWQITKFRNVVLGELKFFECLSSISET